MKIPVKPPEYQKIYLKEIVMKPLQLKALLGILLVISFILSAAISSHADDVTESIDEALEYYEEGNRSDAVESLNYAIQLINQTKSQDLEALLPRPLEGWQIGESGSSSTGAAMMGGSVAAERKYQKDTGEVTISILTDSPFLQSLMMMFSNPAFATADGGKLEKIGRQKAIVKYNSNDKSGSIQIVVAKRFFVSIEGTGISEDILKSYAKGIDYKKLKAVQ